MIHNFVTATVEFVIRFISDTGYFGVWLLLVADAVNLPLPSEIILGFAGYLVNTGRFNYWLVVNVAALGSLGGSILSYWLGMVGGRPFVKKYGKWLMFSQKDLDLADRLFKKYGSRISFFARFFPLLRTVISLPAGITRMPFVKFAVFTYLGSLIWSIILVYFGLVVGENYLKASDSLKWLENVVLIVLLVGFVWWVVRFVRQYLEEKRATKK